MSGIDGYTVSLLQGENLLDYYSSRTWTKAGNPSGSITSAATYPKFNNYLRFLNVVTGGQYISFDTGADSAFSFGSGNWAIDWQMRLQAAAPDIGSGSLLIVQGGGGNYWSIDMYRNGANYEFAVFDGVLGQLFATTVISISLNTWAHWAVQRNGSTLSLSKDGALVASDSTIGGGSLSACTTSFRLLPFTGAGGYNEETLIDEFRVSKGIARYTSWPFTPPTAAYTLEGGNFIPFLI